MDTGCQKFSGRTLFILCCFVALYGSSSAWAQEAVSIKIGGYPELLHEFDMDMLDATINFRLAIIDSLKARSRKIRKLTAEVEMFDTFEEVRAAFLEGKLDAVFCSTAEFFTIEDKVEKGSVYTMSWNDSPTLTYSLVTTRRTAKEVKNLSHLEGKTLLISVLPKIADRLLQAQLVKEGFAGNDFNLKGVLQAPTSQSAIVNLMFGKVDAALVPTIALKQAARSNPQVKQNLKTIFVSEGLVPGVSALRKGLDPDLVELAHERFVNMHQTKAGRKLLEMFQAKRMVAVGAEALAGSRVLFLE